MEHFLNCLHSLRSSISFDMNGVPSWGVDLGEITSPTTTLDEIFHYLESADKPCIVAIDEFQTISSYREANVEAILRTYIQHCHNASFIFAGSQRNMMSEMFLSHARPFYLSTSIKTLKAIDREVYADFATRLFEERQKFIKRETIYQIYDRFDGITWYLQRMLNKIFSLTEKADDKMMELADDKMMELALNSIIDESALHTKHFSFSCQLSKRNFSLPSATLARLKTSCHRHSSRNTIFLPPVLYKVVSRDYWRKILLQRRMELTNCTISSSVNG